MVIFSEVEEAQINSARSNSYINTENLSDKAFNQYFLSSHMNILKPDYGFRNQDMTRPLSYYYINSSKNACMNAQTTLYDALTGQSAKENHSGDEEIERSY
ncbi:hypothetical protein RF11_09549 [Thelohanellus kitauei]|uniref:Uncharacterized protein n=1 Tax=Thelohanellus kitauei TaxID=669202 RepID=A0A0C2ITF2_THEKT|nr:hypothetical protein RF11_09549 [Thelohanellus kitauei]